MNAQILRINSMLSALRALPYSSGPPPWSASPGRRPLLRHLPGPRYDAKGRKVLPALALKRPCFGLKDRDKQLAREPGASGHVLTSVDVAKVFSPGHLVLRSSAMDNAEELLVSASSITSVLSLAPEGEVNQQEDNGVRDQAAVGWNNPSSTGLPPSVEDPPSSSPALPASCSLPGDSTSSLENAEPDSRKASSSFVEHNHGSSLSASASLVSSPSSIGISSLFHDEHAFQLSFDGSIAESASLVLAATTSILPLVNEESDAPVLETAQPCPAPWSAMERLSAMLHDDLCPSQLSSASVTPAVLESPRRSEELDHSLDNIVNDVAPLDALVALESTGEGSYWDLNNPEDAWIPPQEEGIDDWSPSKFRINWDDDVEEPKQEADDVQEGQSLSGTTEEEGAISTVVEVPDLVVTLADADHDEHLLSVEEDEAFDVSKEDSCSNGLPPRFEQGSTQATPEKCPPSSFFDKENDGPGARNRPFEGRARSRVPLRDITDMFLPVPLSADCPPSNVFGKENDCARARGVDGKKQVKSTHAGKIHEDVVDDVLFPGTQAAEDDALSYDVILDKLGRPAKVYAGRRRPARRPLRSITEESSIALPNGKCQPSSLSGKENDYGRVRNIKGKKLLMSTGAGQQPEAIVDDLFFGGQAKGYDAFPRPTRPPLRDITHKVLPADKGNGDLDNTGDRAWIPPQEEGIEGGSPSVKWNDGVEDGKPEADDVQEGQRSSGTRKKAGEEGALSPVIEVPDLVVTLADADNDEHPSSVEEEEALPATQVTENDAPSCVVIRDKLGRPAEVYAGRRRPARRPLRDISEESSIVLSNGKWQQSSLSGKENDHGRVRNIKGKKPAMSTGSGQKPEAVVDNVFFHGPATKGYDAFPRPARRPLCDITHKVLPALTSVKSPANRLTASATPKPCDVRWPEDRRTEVPALRQLCNASPDAPDLASSPMALEPAAALSNALDALGLPPPQLNLPPIADVVRQALPSLPSFKLSDWDIASGPNEDVAARPQDPRFLTPMSSLGASSHEEDDGDISPVTVRQAKQSIALSITPSFLLGGRVVYSTSAACIDDQEDSLSTVPMGLATDANYCSPLDDHSSRSLLARLDPCTGLGVTSMHDPPTLDAGMAGWSTRRV
ncbi:hypothetical protein OE88DRAFT_1644105 [Heliocybe sulcata]|uniref:Uncharacterized protein n=1 Tax=Heliocybe sulcata TaxID=5364 RepID=A0A5C3N4T1_9AGAM|nr:hypothetical protein OE88DRAFT_1644105 [Heliocybe sulcata]